MGAVQNHVARATPNAFQMELFADKLAQYDYQLGKPFTKHGPGANVEIYFHEPSSHRFDYYTGMSTVELAVPRGPTSGRNGKVGVRSGRRVETYSV